MPNSAWNELSDLNEVLQPIIKLTAKLQSETLTVQQFYLNWQMATTKLEGLESKKAELLLKEIVVRENEILASPIILAGIFLDPRLKSLLKPEQIVIAKDEIRSVFSKKKVLDRFVDTSDDDEVVKMEVVDEDMAALEGKLGSVAQNTLERELDNYQVNNRPASIDVTKFWLKAVNEFPFLCSIVNDIISIPVTEASVESLLSHLNIFMNEQQTNFDDGLLEDILFLRINKKFDE